MFHQESAAPAIGRTAFAASLAGELRSQAVFFEPFGRFPEKLLPWEVLALRQKLETGQAQEVQDPIVRRVEQVRRKQSGLYFLEALEEPNQY